MAVPDGSGLPLTQATLSDGTTVDASIHIRIVDVSGIPVPNYPFQDIWLASDSAGEFSCTIKLSADHDTDTNGETSFSNPLMGGGTSAGPFWVYLNGTKACTSAGFEHPSIPIRLNSPDLNGDGYVNLSDVAIFISDYYGPYDYRSDFLWDGRIDLSDVRLLAKGVGTYCP